MKVTWLGQAGLLFENENIKINLFEGFEELKRHLLSLI